ncbi:MAG: hypothetical protein FWF07_04775, partial [Methanomassiliicoccaceae archaeon]|nr:hypothetical protein [Methanomassiliicoccaceae archaeon]
MKLRIRGLKRSKDGSMPFVAIAVVILILGSAYGIMISQAKEMGDTADNIVTEIGSLDTAITDTETFVERGLGEVIFNISTDPNGGPLDKRISAFKERSEKWMKSNFPNMDKGVSVSIRDFDFVLEAESLKMTSADEFTDGFTPSYLKATGHYTANFISGSGTVMKTTEITTDGTCALPLVAEQGSLFGMMVADDGSALSQMMTHQLTALAQYRVLNGYGALSEYGNMGTLSILTAADVKNAYESSMKVLSMLVFHCSEDGLGGDMTKIDLADLLIADKGFIEIDLSAVYSQALISIMDDLVLRWFDYLCGNLMIDMLDFITDGLKNAWDSLKGFFSGKNEFSAAPYIERVMADKGADINYYRYLFSGKTSAIQIAGIEVALGGKTVKIPSMTLRPNYPSVDLMSWSGVSNFKSEYRADTNEIREWIRNIINTAAVSVGTSKALGTIRVPIDPNDNESFMETVYKAVDTSLRNGNSEVDRIMTSAIKDQSINDPFCSAIYQKISENYDRIYGTDTYRENIRTSAVSAVTTYLEDSGIAFESADINRIADILVGGNEVKDALAQYSDAVGSCVIGLKALADVPAGKSGVIKDICTSIFKMGVLAVDVMIDVPQRIRTLCSEAIENTNINAYSGVIELPGSDCFKLSGTDGNTSVEKLSVSSVSSPKI